MSINRCIRVQRAQRKRDIEAARRLTRSVDSLQATSGWVPVGRVTAGRSFFKKDLLVLAPIPVGGMLIYENSGRPQTCPVTGSLDQFTNK